MNWWHPTSDSPWRIIALTTNPQLLQLRLSSTTKNNKNGEKEQCVFLETSLRSELISASGSVTWLFKNVAFQVGSSRHYNVTWPHLLFKSLIFSYQNCDFLYLSLKTVLPHPCQILTKVAFSGSAFSYQHFKSLSVYSVWG